MKYQFYKPQKINERVFCGYFNKVNNSQWYTNNGPLVNDLTRKIEVYLDIKNLLLVSSGTVALQVAYKAMQCEGKVITTPLSFIATSSAFGWIGSEIAYSDIDYNTLNLKPEYMLNKGLDRSDAIVATHLYGNPCDIKSFANLQKKSGCKIIYDASHAFASKYKGRNILNYGDASVISFHATKLFHTIEGGGIVFSNKDDLERAKRMINFGFGSSNSIEDIGINAKMSELHAAVGLTLLDELDSVIDKRALLVKKYQELLSKLDLKIIPLQEGTDQASPSYMPIVLSSGEERDALLNSLLNEGIETRNYFDSLQSSMTLFNSKPEDLPNAQQYDKRVLCLPLYPDLTIADIDYISKKLESCLMSYRSAV